jgi:hypothetical protein
MPTHLDGINVGTPIREKNLLKKGLIIKCIVLLSVIILFCDYHKSSIFGRYQLLFRHMFDSFSAKVTITVVIEPKDLTPLISKPTIQHNPEPVTFPPILTPKLEGCPYCKTLVRYKGSYTGSSIRI